MVATENPSAAGVERERFGLPAWGKYDKTTGRIHRLEHHCADVAACFEALVRDPVLRARFAQAAGGSFTATTAARLAVLAFLHDFGKLNSGFQFKVPRPVAASECSPSRAGHIGEALLCIDRPKFCEDLGLFELAEEWGEGAVQLLYAALAHHGRPARRPTATGGGSPELWAPYGGYCPRATAKLLGARAREWFPRAFSPGPPLPDQPALAHLFAGVVALADQLGSDERIFEYEEEADPRYIDRARQRAARTVADSRFSRAGWREGLAGADVRTLFGYEEARPLQVAATEASLEKPLLILESETGSGKTEAALLRYAALVREGIVDGLYFALPTRAAAKQLHARVNRAMERLYPASARVETVLAVPGYLRVGEVEGKRAGRFDVSWDDDPDDEKKRQSRWSAESARKFLSAPTGVGTVDQALLAGLRVKWAHFRGSALARSLLVVDEVHASDAYMTELLLGVLRSHLALGGHAVLMSATLGAAASAKLVSNASGCSAPTPKDALGVPYPSLTLAGGAGPPDVVPVEELGRAKTVSMEPRPILGDPAAIAHAAGDAAERGAKVLVIRNTVKSAQATFAELRAQGKGDLALTVEGGPALHHSRFAAEDRNRLDDAVENSLGKEDRPPGGVVVIGTQTLEQSLDIDADLLITDLCPVDVLLQRVGRLHRHQRADRPGGFRRPKCVVLTPEGGLGAGLDGSLLAHGLGAARGGGGIYENLVGLEATRRLVDDLAAWTIPSMNRRLVEDATHPERLEELAGELGADWREHLVDREGSGAAHIVLARNNGLRRDEAFIDEYGDALAFAANDHEVRMRTRLGEDGPRIVLPKPLAGPFGGDVQTFNLPAAFFWRDRPSREEIEAAWAEPSGRAGQLVLTVGEYRLLYDRAGIRTDA